jgi:hypothetical protein
VKRLTPAQRHALRLILRGEVRSISEVDTRVRRGLEARGLLAWDRDPGSKTFGQFDREAMGVVPVIGLERGE